MDQNINFEFNMQSGAHREKLSEPARAQLDAIQENGKAAAQQQEADFQLTRERQIAEHAENLTPTLEAKMNMPRPDWVPVEEMPTREDILTESTKAVDKGHVVAKDTLDFNYSAAQEAHVRQELNMPRENDPGYEARRSAFLERRQQERESGRDREL